MRKNEEHQWAVDALVRGVERAVTGSVEAREPDRYKDLAKSAVAAFNRRAGLPPDAGPQDVPEHPNPLAWSDAQYQPLIDAFNRALDRALDGAAVRINERRRVKASE